MKRQDIALTSDQLIELVSLHETSKAIDGRTIFMSKTHFEGLYDALFGHGLVTWGRPPKGFSRTRFAGTKITKRGIKYLASHEGASDGVGAPVGGE